jgi:hypothetical protein
VQGRGAELGCPVFVEDVDPSLLQIMADPVHGRANDMGGQRIEGDALFKRAVNQGAYRVSVPTFQGSE